MSIQSNLRLTLSSVKFYGNAMIYSNSDNEQIACLFNTVHVPFEVTWYLRDKSSHQN